MPPLDRPNDFLTVRVHELNIEPTLSGLCVGYERGEWRYNQFADHIMEWIPEFSLNASELDQFGHSTSVKLLRRAAQLVYKSEKFKNRGEFGELFLHIAIRQVFDSLPAISKIYYKDSRNDTVKGFDAVHVIGPPDDMELWLGEVKFYTDIQRAIRDVISEIDSHTTTQYLRDEFSLILNKIDANWEHASALKKLLSPKTSLDDVFSRVCIPVLLAYNSDCISKYSLCCSDYESEFRAEILKHHWAFCEKALPREIRIHLFLLPLAEKTKLTTILDERLKTWQRI